MKTKLLIILIISLVINPVYGLAQKQSTYEYDDAGNRTKRQTIVLNKAGENLEETNQEDNIAQIGNITIYPNPTEGKLVIQIEANANALQAQLKLYDMNGRLLIDKNTSGSLTHLDLRAYTPAVYMLRISSGNKKTEFKVIKK